MKAGNLQLTRADPKGKGIVSQKPSVDHRLSNKSLFIDTGMSLGLVGIHHFWRGLHPPYQKKQVA